MIPLLAAVTAINTVNSVGQGALAVWKQWTSSGHAAGKNQASAASDSFGALLAAHGVSSGGTAPSAGVGTSGIR